MTYASISQNQGSQFRLPETPQASGFRFLGWFTEPEGGDKITEDTLVSGASRKLYARWERTGKDEKITFG